jgi:hypothetical protein
MQSSNKAMKPRHCFLFPICAVLHHSCATPTGIASTMTQGTPKIAADNVMGGYRYAITAPKEATLSLDKEPTTRLRLEGPAAELGPPTGDMRRFAFTIARTDGG